MGQLGLLDVHADEHAAAHCARDEAARVLADRASIVARAEETIRALAPAHEAQVNAVERAISTAASLAGL